ncbi:MAG: hypothetical protein IKF99_10065 [Oscillospiraceae bacterium]|nr:hypothetical protein [Oscillospiraceae bacterium]
MFGEWYTDSADVYRMEQTVEGGVTRQARQQVASAVPCRVYSTTITSPSMQNTAARDMKTDKLACPLGTDIHKGDEIIVTRGAAVGGAAQTRYIAGAIQYYYDPVGGALTALNHIEVGLLDENIME